ncbi:hypothetical protein ACFL5V_13520, partial [Fibrobacterota bacterium]
GKQRTDLNQGACVLAPAALGQYRISGKAKVFKASVPGVAHRPHGGGYRIRALGLRTIKHSNIQTFEHSIDEPNQMPKGGFPVSLKKQSIDTRTKSDAQ